MDLLSLRQVFCKSLVDGELDLVVRVELLLVTDHVQLPNYLCHFPFHYCHPVKSLFLLRRRKQIPILFEQKRT